MVPSAYYTNYVAHLKLMLTVETQLQTDTHTHTRLSRTHTNQLYLLHVSFMHFYKLQSVFNEIWVSAKLNEYKQFP